MDDILPPSLLGAAYLGWIYFAVTRLRQPIQRWVACIAPLAALGVVVFLILGK